MEYAQSKDNALDVRAEREDVQQIATPEIADINPIAVGKLPRRERRIMRAAEELAGIAALRGAEQAKVEPDTRRLSEFDRQLSGILAENAVLFSTEPTLRTRVLGGVFNAYNQSRLEVFENTVLGLSIERGRLLGKRHLDYARLKEVDERLECYCRAHQDLLRCHVGATGCVNTIIERGQQRGLDKCMQAEKIAAELWSNLFGAVSTKFVLRPIAWIFSKKEAALLQMAELSPRRMALVKEFFQDRYNIDLGRICDLVMSRSGRFFARDLIEGSAVQVASSGIAHFMCLGKKAREGTKILQEIRRLLIRIDKNGKREVRRDFKLRFAADMKAKSIDGCLHCRLPEDSYRILSAILSDNMNRANLLLFVRLLKGDKNNIKEAADFLEELSVEERKGLCSEFAKEFPDASIGEYVTNATKGSRPLRDLILGLLEDDCNKTMLACLHLGLSGDKEEWPGTPFLGKNVHEGEKLIEDFDSIYGKGCFDGLLAKYRGSDRYLIKSLIKNTIAPAAEIYYANTHGLGSDIPSLRLLVQSSTAAQLRKDGEEYERLWEERSWRLQVALRKVYKWVEPILDKTLGHSRLIGALMGNFKDVLWLNTQGDDWKDLEINFGGKTDDPVRLYSRACRAVAHELKLPLISSIRWISMLVGRELRLTLSREGLALERDFRLLQDTFEAQICNAQCFASAEERKHFKTLVERVHTDRLTFREHKRLLGHWIASTGAGAVSSMMGGYLLLECHWSILSVLLPVMAADFTVRTAIKTLVKGRDSCTGEERLNDAACSAVNGGSLNLKPLSKAFSVFRRVFGEQILEKGADFASKIGGKWTLTNVIKRLVTRQTANHLLTPEELRKGVFEDEPFPNMRDLRIGCDIGEIINRNGSGTFNLFLRSLNVSFGA